MTSELWAIVGSMVVGLAAQLLTYQRLRGEFRSIMRNFPPHRHINGKILFPKEYPPTEVEGQGSNG